MTNNNGTRISVITSPAPNISTSAAPEPSKNKHGDLPRNASIDGLRGFAALVVAAFHIYKQSVKGNLIHEVSPRSAWLIVEAIGPFAVVLFFFISGYLIVQTLVKHGNVSTFLKNRFVRIYPLFLILTAFIFLTGPITGFNWMGSINHSAVDYARALVTNLLLLPGIFDLPIAHPYAWSLSYEFAFYFLACGFYAAIRLSPEKKAGKWTALLALTASTVTLIAFRNLAFYFLVGVAAYFLESRNKLKRSPLLAVCAALAPIFLVLSFSALRINMLLCAGFGLLFFLTIVAQQGPMSKLLQTRFFRFTGKVSYSLYLVHPFVYDPIRIVFAKLRDHFGHGEVFVAVFYAVGLPLAIAAAAVSYNLIENKLTNKYIRPLLRSKSVTTEKD